MTKKIFKSIMVVAMAVLAASLVLIMGCLYEYFSGVQGKQLELIMIGKAGTINV